MAISDGVPATAANLNAAFVSLSAENTFPEEQTYEKGLLVKEIATPATPASGYLAVYAKTDGEAYVKNDAGTETKISNATATLSNAYQKENYSLTGTVAANALTVALKSNAGTDPSSSDLVTIAFRSSTATSGVYVKRTVSAALSVVVSSGSTLGHASAVNQYVHVYAIDNAGTVELAVSGQRLSDETALVSTTAEGGAGAADSAVLLYSTTARSNVACRYLGRMKSSQATAGTWASSITEISNDYFSGPVVRSEVFVTGANGYGSTNTKIRRLVTSVTNTGSAITFADTAANGSSFTINEDGIYSISYVDGHGANFEMGISKNSSQLTTNIQTITNADRLIKQNVASGFSASVSCSCYLRTGDIIRPHTDAPATPYTGDSVVSFRITKVGN